MTLYGIIGNPLDHSFSRDFFNAKFQREGIDAQYLNFPIPDISAFPDIVASHPDLRGLNVTLPYKQAIIPLLDDLSDEARAIGAVNVIGVYQGRLVGYNTDVVGFRQSLEPLLQPHHTRALVLGTGGASKAVGHALTQMGIAWQYVSRTAAADHLTYGDLDADIMAAHPLIVNTTPLGMSPHTETCAPLSYHLLTPRHLLYDVVYNPEETLFMRWGSHYGAATKGGLEMLHLQALAAWDIWGG